MPIFSKLKLKIFDYKIDRDTLLSFAKKKKIAFKIDHLDGDKIIILNDQR